MESLETLALFQYKHLQGGLQQVYPGNVQVASLGVLAMLVLRRKAVTFNTCAYGEGPGTPTRAQSIFCCQSTGAHLQTVSFLSACLLLRSLPYQVSRQTNLPAALSDYPHFSRTLSPCRNQGGAWPLCGTSPDNAGLQRHLYDRPKHVYCLKVESCALIACGASCRWSHL